MTASQHRLSEHKYKNTPRAEHLVLGSPDKRKANAKNTQLMRTEERSSRILDFVGDLTRHIFLKKRWEKRTYDQPQLCLGFPQLTIINKMRLICYLVSTNISLHKIQILNFRSCALHMCKMCTSPL